MYLCVGINLKNLKNEENSIDMHYGHFGFCM